MSYFDGINARTCHMKNILGILGISFFSATLGGLMVTKLDQQEPSAPLVTPVVHSAPYAGAPSPPNRMPPSTARAEGLPHFRDAAHRALDAVVHVRTAQSVSPRQGWSTWYGFFQQPSAPERVQMGSGSGVIIDREGFIVTNHHVIEGADVVEVGLNDNRTLPAQIVGADPTTDIAVLKVDADQLNAVDWGDSDAVQVGDWVLAVGNPFDLTSTVTAGIVSAKARDIQLLRPDFDRSLFPIESFIQTDAAVNPGNSGGALVDTQGQLIGINTAIASRTGSYAGYAFAVPSNLARKVATDLIEFGAVQRAYLGVGIRPVDEMLAERLALPRVAGVLVTSVSDGSGAELGGIEPGDVILSVGGTSTSTMPQLLERVNRYRPGQVTEVELWREGDTVLLTVELGTREGTSTGVKPETPDDTATLDNGPTDDVATIWGCRLRSCGEGKSGVEVIDPGLGPFAKAGIRAGTVILTVDGKTTDGVDEFAAALSNSAKGNAPGILLEGRDPDGKPAWFGVAID